MAETRTDLLVVIKGVATDFVNALNGAKKSSKEFNEDLIASAAQGAAAFASIKLAIFDAVEGYGAVQQASQQLNQALAQQGLYSKEAVDSYSQISTGLSKLTGTAETTIKGSLALAQNMLGQIVITDELAEAAANLAAGQKIGLDEALTKVAKTIGTHTNALAKNGIAIDQNASKQDKMREVISKINAAYGGQAEASKTVLTSMANLKVSIGNVQEALGERFAPSVQRVSEYLIAFFDRLQNNKPLLDMIGYVTLAVAGFLAFAAGAAAIGQAYAFVIQGLAGIVAAFSGLATAIKVVSTAILANPILAVIAGIIAGLTLLYLNWDKVLGGIAAITKSYTDNIGQIMAGLSEVFQGAITFDPSRVKAGLATIGAAIKKGVSEISATYKGGLRVPAADTTEYDAAEAKRLANLKENADKRTALENAHNSRLRQIQRLETENMIAATEGGSKEIIALKQREIDILKQIDSTENPGKLKALKKSLADVQVAKEEAHLLDIEQRAIFANEILEQDALYNELTLNQKEEFKRKYMDANQAGILTEETARDKVLKDRAKREQDAHNRELEDRVRYGAAYAAINKFLHSEEVVGTKNATGELVQLQNSKHNTLKSIGKAAAVAQIGIKTAESAMNVYAGFSTIPIIGQALGIAGAAAAIAFGAEQVGTVLGLASGGLVTGGIPGVDSIPAMLSPGELVVPTKNFDQVVGAVRGENGSNASDPQIVSLLTSINDKFARPSQTIIQGDVMADDTFVDALIRKINDRLEFGNAQLAGV